MLNPINKHTVLKQAKTEGSWEGYVAPSKVNSYHINDGWHIGMSIRIIKDADTNELNMVGAAGISPLDDFLKEFAYYNCNSELGQRVRFWEVAK